MKTTFRIEGFADFDRKMMRFAEVADNKPAVVAVMIDALMPIRDEAARLAPSRTGNLRREMIVSDRALFDRDHRDVFAAVYVGPSREAFYAGWVENGRLAGADTPAVAPQPFLRPAWDGGQGQVLKRLADGLGSVINKKG